MPDVLISGLSAAGALAAADLIEVEQGVVPSSASGKATLGALKTFINKRPVPVLAISSGLVAVDCSLGRDFTLALTANATISAPTGLAGAGFVTEFELQITQDPTGSRTLALPASFKALGGSDTAIATAANSVTVLSAKTFDNGTTWRYAMQESA